LGIEMMQIILAVLDVVLKRLHQSVDVYGILLLNITGLTVTICGRVVSLIATFIAEYIIGGALCILCIRICIIIIGVV